MIPITDKVPPLQEAIHLAEKKLRQVVNQAYRSPLYRERWRAKKVQPNAVHHVEDLSRLPFVTRREVFTATRTLRSRVACSPIYTWFAGSSSNTLYEWVPFSANDFLGIAPLIARMSRVVGLESEDIVLAVTDPSPRVYSFIPFLWTASTTFKSPRPEFITVSLAWYENLGMTWIDFIQRRQPTVLFTSTTNALTLAEKIQHSFKVQAKDVLRKTRIGVLYGQPLEHQGYRLGDAYAFPVYAVYSPTEFLAFCCECRPHHGIHLWVDACIPEIIPANREEAIPVWEASQNTVGELVLTTFAECLPLIRYKTGERVTVREADCVCGRNHPKIARGPAQQTFRRAPSTPSTS